MKYLIQVLLFVLVFSSCGSKTWQADRQIDLGSAFPIGITTDDAGYWISDGNNNELLHFGNSGNLIRKIDSFERPMHITSVDGNIYVPEYGKDQITIITEGQKSVLELSDSLDAPGGVDVSGEDIVIADFYNHRILLKTDGNWKSIGKEGKGPKDFYYPNNQVFVMDQENDRVLIYDHNGKLLQTLEEGFDKPIDAALVGDELFVLNFGGKNIQVLK